MAGLNPLARGWHGNRFSGLPVQIKWFTNHYFQLLSSDSKHLTIGFQLKTSNSLHPNLNLHVLTLHIQFTTFNSWRPTQCSTIKIWPLTFHSQPTLNIPSSTFSSQYLTLDNQPSTSNSQLSLISNHILTSNSQHLSTRDGRLLRIYARAQTGYWLYGWENL